MIRRVLSRLAESKQDWRMGRGYGYPACCVAHYCWDILLARGPTTVRYAQVQYEWAGPGLRWDWYPRPWDEMKQVPCGVFHSKGSRLPLTTRTWRIVAYNLPFLPTPVAALGCRKNPPQQVEWADDPTYDSWLTGLHLDRELEWS